jgi:peptide chain release factor 2
MLLPALPSSRRVFDIAGKTALRDQFTARMGQGNFWDNQEKAQEVIGQLKPLNALLNPFQDLKKELGDLRALEELSDEDASLDGEMEKELAATEHRLAEFELQAMMSGPQDASNAYVRIQAGTGGTEACDWAQMLMRMYARWAERKGYETEIVDELRNDEAGIRNATLYVKGENAYGWLQCESGVHRLVRISPFDANKRRQTSFAAVDVLPEIEGNIEIEIRPDELERETFRSGGPGGQHQNKTESGVRYRHIPTGICAESRNERSQHKNSAVALALLKSKLFKIEEQKRLAEVEKQYDEKGEVAWGYQIRNYVMQPYTLVKDVRTETETAQVQKVLDGDLEDFMEAFLRKKAEKEHKKRSA